MTIIYTCPKCGNDLDEIVLASYPPQYKKSCSKCGWSITERIKKDENIKRIPYPLESNPVAIEDFIKDLNLDLTHINYAINIEPEIKSQCASCSNHPSNGGSGICHCIIGIPDITV